MKSWAVYSQNCQMFLCMKEIPYSHCKSLMGKERKPKNPSWMKKRILKFKKHRTDGILRSLNPFCYLKYTFTETEGRWGRGENLSGKDYCPCLFSGAWGGWMWRWGTMTVRVLLHSGHLIFGCNSRHSLSSLFQYKIQGPQCPGAGVGVSEKMKTILFFHTLKIFTRTAKFGFRSWNYMWAAESKAIIKYSLIPF